MYPFSIHHRLALRRYPAVRLSQPSLICSRRIRKTLHKTEAQFISRFGWGLTRRIEEYGVHKFKVNLEKVRMVEIFQQMVVNIGFGSRAKDSRS